MQPSSGYALLPGKLDGSQPATPVACHDHGNLFGGKLSLMIGAGFHPHSLALPAGLNRLHPPYRLLKNRLAEIRLLAVGRP